MAENTTSTKAERIISSTPTAVAGITENVSMAYDRPGKPDEKKKEYTWYSFSSEKGVTIPTLVEFLKKEMRIESPESYIIRWFEMSQKTKARNAAALELRQSRDDDPLKALSRQVKDALEKNPKSKKALAIQSRLQEILSGLDLDDDESDSDSDS